MLAKTFLTSHLAVISYIFHMLDSWVRRPHLMRRQICLQDCLVSNLHRQLLLMPKFKRNSVDKINNRANHCSLESKLETYNSTIKFLAQELEHEIMNKLTSKIGLFEISKYVIRMGWIIIFFVKQEKVRASTPFLLKTHGIMYIMKMVQRYRGESWKCTNFDAFFSFTPSLDVFSCRKACNIAE